MIKNSKLAAVLFVFVTVYLTGCGTMTPANMTRQSLAGAQLYHIAPEDYERYNGIVGTFLGEGLVIMEMTKQVGKIGSLRGSEAVSFTEPTMPKDLKQILQKYTMSSGENFYDYVVEYTNRFIFCPDLLTRWSYRASGMALTNASSDMLYPGENITFLNMQQSWNQTFLPYWYIAHVSVHEAVHHKLTSLILAGEVSTEYYRMELGERYVVIVSLEFLYALLEDPAFAKVRDEIEMHISDEEEEIDRYNIRLGLPFGDKTLFPR